MDSKLSNTLLTGPIPSWWAGEGRGTHPRAQGLGEKPRASVHTSNPTCIGTVGPPSHPEAQLPERYGSQGALVSRHHPALTPGWRDQPGQVQAQGSCSWTCTARLSWRPHRGPTCTNLQIQVLQVWKWARQVGCPCRVLGGFPRGPDSVVWHASAHLFLPLCPVSPGRD